MLVERHPVTTSAASLSDIIDQIDDSDTASLIRVKRICGLSRTNGYLVRTGSEMNHYLSHAIELRRQLAAITPHSEED